MTIGLKALGHQRESFMAIGNNDPGVVSMCNTSAAALCLGVSGGKKKKRKKKETADGKVKKKKGPHPQERLFETRCR